jgi:uncharacterized protein YaaN involved in tellurite resistance
LSTKEPDTVATTPSSQLPALANVLPDGQKINLTKFDDPQRQRITDIASTVGILDSAAVTSFGVEAQRKMNSFLDQLLQGIRTYHVRLPAFDDVCTRGSSLRQRYTKRGTSHGLYIRKFL